MAWVRLAWRASALSIAMTRYPSRVVTCTGSYHSDLLLRCTVNLLLPSRHPDKTSSHDELVGKHKLEFLAIEAYPYLNKFGSSCVYKVGLLDSVRQLRDGQNLN